MKRDKLLFVIAALMCQITVKDGKIVYDLNGLSRPEWTTLPPNYTAVGDPHWDRLNPARGGSAH